MLFRNICESYPGLDPQEISKLSLDQIYTLGTDRKMLERITGAIVTGTPAELASRGVIPREKESLLKILKREKLEKERQDNRKARRKRRQENRDAAIAYKRKKGQT